MGLRSGWTCQRSGDCCTKPGAIVVTGAERAALEAAHPSRPARYRPHPSDARFFLLDAGPCPYYERGCTVYAVRPMNCRRYGCGRVSLTEPFEDTPIPVRFVTDRAFRRQYQLMQRDAQRWGRAYGWPDA